MIQEIWKCRFFSRFLFRCLWLLWLLALNLIIPISVLSRWSRMTSLFLSSALFCTNCIVIARYCNIFLAISYRDSSLLSYRGCILCIAILLSFLCELRLLILLLELTISLRRIPSNFARWCLRSLFCYFSDIKLLCIIELMIPWRVTRIVSRWWSWCHSFIFSLTLLWLLQRNMFEAIRVSSN